MAAPPGSIPLPTDFLSLPSKVTSLELNLNTLKSRVDGHDKSIQTQNQQLSTLQSDLNTTKSNLANLQNLQSQLDQRVSGIRGLTSGEVDLLGWASGKRSSVDDVTNNFSTKADDRVRATANQAYVRGMIDKSFVQGFIDQKYVQGFVPKSYLTGLDLKDTTGVSTIVRNLVPQIVDQSFVKGLVNESYGNLSTYNSKFPKLDTIPTDLSIKNLINQSYVRGLIDQNFIKSNLPNIDTFLNNTNGFGKALQLLQYITPLKSTTDKLQSSITEMNTAGNSYVSHMTALLTNLDDWVTGGPDKIKPSYTDIGAWGNLFKALAANMGDLMTFMQKLSTFKDAMTQFNGAIKNLPTL